MFFTLAITLVLQAAPKAPAPTTLFTDKSPLVNMIASLPGDTIFAQTWSSVTAFKRKDGSELWKSGRIVLEIQEGPVPKKADFAKRLPAPMLAASSKHLFVGTNTMLPSFQSYDLETGEKGTSQGGTDFKKHATCMLTNKNGTYVYFGIENIGVSRMGVGNVDDWSRRGTDNGGVTCFALDKKEKVIAMGGSDGSVRYINFTSASLDKKKHHKTGMGPISAIRFAKKGKSVLVGNEKGEVQVLNTSKGKQLLTLEGPNSAVRWIRVQAKNKWAVVGYANGKLRFFELKKGTQLLELEHPEAKLGIVGLALGDKDQTLLSAGGKTVLSWDLGGHLK
ncbi:MAG: hypothetical protein ACI87O_002791 [Planctomycetota bacterium]|jgi:hypothetical protein